MKSPWVRLVLAISLDGRLAFPLGGASPLGGSADRRALEEALAWADGTLMGDKTLRIHRSTCLVKESDLLEKRSLEGRSQQPISIIVSQGIAHSKSWSFFKQPIKRWLLRPIQSDSTAEQFDESQGYERQLAFIGDWSITLVQLAELGISRLVLLGGAKLLNSLLHADLVDELQLTITPRIVGGSYTWVPISNVDLPSSIAASGAWNLKENQHIGQDELMVRYFRNRSKLVEDL